MKRLIVLLFVLMLSLHWLNAQEDDDKLHLNLDLGLLHSTDNNLSPVGGVSALEFQLFRRGYGSVSARAEMGIIGSKSLNLHPNLIRDGATFPRTVFSISPIWNIHFLKGISNLS